MILVMVCRFAIGRKLAYTERSSPFFFRSGVTEATLNRNGNVPSVDESAARRARESCNSADFIVFHLIHSNFVNSPLNAWKLRFQWLKAGINAKTARNATAITIGVSPRETNCDLSLKYELSHCNAHPEIAKFSSSWDFSVKSSRLT